MILESFVLLMIIGYGLLYVSGRKYLEAFHNDTTSSSSPSSPSSIKPPEKPYTRAPIDSVDQYELSAVYHNQGSKETSKKQIRDAMARYPMDWVNTGPDSQHFQEQQHTIQQASHGSRVEGQPASSSLSSSTLTGEPLSQDQLLQEQEERKILQMYQPEKSTKLLEYSVEDVKTLVDRVYDRKGLIPEIVKSKQGHNVWEITEVKEKNPKIVWEDQVPTQEREKQMLRGEETIQVPYTVSDVAAGLDPFFQKGASSRVRDGRYQYNEWTPGLERMFAPTYPIKEWL